MGLALPDWRLVHPWALHPGRYPTEPVVIDWSHKDLVGARYICTGFGGKPQIHGATGDGFEVNGTYIADRNLSKSATAGSRILLPALGSAWRDAGSILFAGYWDGTDYGGNYARLLAETTDQIIYQVGGGADWVLAPGWGNTTTPRSTGNQAWCITSEGGFSGTRKAYKDGSMLNVDTNTLSNTLVNDPFSFGNSGVFDRATFFSLGYLIVYDITLTEARAVKQTRDPYQFLIPA